MKKFKVVFKELRDDLEIEADGYIASESGVDICFVEFYKRLIGLTGTNIQGKELGEDIISIVNADGILYIIECPETTNNINSKIIPEPKP